MEHHRVSDEGKTLGRLSAAIAEVGAKVLLEANLSEISAPHVRGQMCESCACKAVSVHNDSLQTVMALLEDEMDMSPFRCLA